MRFSILHSLILASFVAALATADHEHKNEQNHNTSEHGNHEHERDSKIPSFMNFPRASQVYAYTVPRTSFCHEVAAYHEIAHDSLASINECLCPEPNSSVPAGTQLFLPFNEKPPTSSYPPGKPERINLGQRFTADGQKNCSVVAAEHKMHINLLTYQYSDCANSSAIILNGTEIYEGGVALREDIKSCEVQWSLNGDTCCEEAVHQISPKVTLEVLQQLNPYTCRNPPQKDQDGKVIKPMPQNICLKWKTESPADRCGGNQKLIKVQDDKTTFESLAKEQRVSLKKLVEQNPAFCTNISHTITKGSHLCLPEPLMKCKDYKTIGSDDYITWQVWAESRGLNLDKLRELNQDLSIEFNPTATAKGSQIPQDTRLCVEYVQGCPQS